MCSSLRLIGKSACILYLPPALFLALFCLFCSELLRRGLKSEGGNGIRSCVRGMVTLSARLGLRLLLLLSLCHSHALLADGVGVGRRAIRTPATAAYARGSRHASAFAVERKCMNKAPYPALSLGMGRDCYLRYYYRACCFFSIAALHWSNMHKLHVKKQR